MNGRLTGDALDRALEESRRALSRIEALLDDLAHPAPLTRILAPTKFAPVAMGELAREVASSFEHLADHVIEIAPGDALPAYGDAARLRQVLTNVIGNAIVHVPEGCNITVSIAARAGRVVTAVTDDGPGIPADIRPRVFGRFQRGDSLDGQGGPGAGLGLYIARTIVEAHGGEIRAEERPGGRGVSVVIELPSCAKGEEG